MAIAFTQTIGSIRLDNQRVTLAGSEVGTTKGGVTVTYQAGVLEVTGDQYGITPLNTYSTGDRITIKFALMESTYATLTKLMHGSTLRTTGGTGLGIGGKLSSSFVGTTIASAIILHPLDTDDGTLTKDVNIWKAVPISLSPVKFGPDEVTIWECEFVAIVDTGKTAGKQLIDFGLAAAT